MICTKSEQRDHDVDKSTKESWQDNLNVKYKSDNMGQRSTLVCLLASSLGSIPSDSKTFAGEILMLQRFINNSAA